MAKNRVQQIMNAQLSVDFSSSGHYKISGYSKVVFYYNHMIWKLGLEPLTRPQLLIV